MRDAKRRALLDNDEVARSVHAVTWFTDNVVVGTPVSDDINRIEMALGLTAIGAGYMQLLMLNRGYLGRGAIAFGPHHMQEEFVFGHALVEAAELEKKTKWPRVALTPLAADFIRAIVHDSYSDPKDSPQACEYLVDDDGDVVFVDHLGLWLSEEDDEEVATQLLRHLRGVIGYALVRENGEVFDKWKWLADMHNHVLDQIPHYQQFRIDAGEPRYSFRSFVSTL